MSESNTQKILRILIAPAATLEAAMLQVLYLRSIDTAVGAQLTVLGTIVGREREGVTDDDIYRRYLRAQITMNKSDGTINTLLKVAEFVVDDDAATFTLRNEGAAAFALQVGGVAITEPVADVLIELIIRATSGGVRPIIEYALSPPADVFQFDDGPGFDVGRYSTAVDHVI
jgi:hypothetical protein